MRIVTNKKIYKHSSAIDTYLYHVYNDRQGSKSSTAEQAPPGPHSPGDETAAGYHWKNKHFS